MQSEIWLREDVLNALRAVAEAGLASATAASQPDTSFGRGYQQGFATALRAVGAAFGLQTHVGSLLRLADATQDQEGNGWSG